MSCRGRLGRDPVQAMAAEPVFQANGCMHHGLVHEGVTCNSFRKVRLRDRWPLPMGVAIGPFNPMRFFCMHQADPVSGVGCHAPSSTAHPLCYKARLLCAAISNCLKRFESMQAHALAWHAISLVLYMMVCS